MEMVLAAGVYVCNRNREHSENSENGENSVNRIVCCGVGCIPRVNMLKMVKVLT